MAVVDIDKFIKHCPDSCLRNSWLTRVSMVGNSRQSGKLTSTHKSCKASQMLQNRHCCIESLCTACRCLPSSRNHFLNRLCCISIICSRSPTGPSKVHHQHTGQHSTLQYFSWVTPILYKCSCC